MDALSGVNSSLLLNSINASNNLASSYGLIAAEQSLSTLGLFGNDYTRVQLSGNGLLLSAVSSFWDQLKTLQPGSASGSGGQNFGTDFASLAAETQSLVDALNSLQKNVTSLNGTNSFFAGDLNSAAGLQQSLANQVRANYSNGDSALTNLAQLGISFQPSLLPGGGGILSLDLEKLQAAFNSDSSGAFSLLTSAKNAFSDLAQNFLTQVDNTSPMLNLFSQSAGGFASNSNGLDIASLLSSGVLNNKTSLPQVYNAISQYNLISTLYA